MLLSILTQLPYAQAWLFPPAKTAFVGFFYYVDDQYNYLSYVEQAERGAFFFENKLVLEPHPRALVNLEWWIVGRLSAVLGGRPFLAYRCLALVACLALLAGLDTWLRHGGLSATHRVPALLLIGLGGGLGGLAWKADWLPLHQALDLSTGAFPFIELLANPHFTTGTALLIWTLWRLSTASRPVEHAQGVLLGTVLGLVRPYDLILVGASRVLGIAFTEPARRWPSSLAPLLGLAPVVAYNAWVFYLLPSFRSFGLNYVAPPLVALVVALGPVALLAGLVFTRRPDQPQGRSTLVHLSAWATVALAIVALQPVGFALQFLVGAAVPLLTLGALGLDRFPRAATLAAALALGSNSLIALDIVLSNNPNWYVSSERPAAAEALRGTCRAGDIVMAPQDIGFYAMGRTACKPYVSHVVAPDFERRLETTLRFYGPLDAGERENLLAGLGVSQLVLPGDPGPVPESWLGPHTPFRRQATIGRPATVSVYANR